MHTAPRLFYLLVGSVPGHAQDVSRGALVGSVVDALHEPIAQARVEVRLAGSGATVGTGTTDGTGRFSIARLPAGTSVVVRASAPGRTEVESVTDVAAAGAGTDLAFTLWDAGTITGTVVDAAGVAVPEAIVWAEPRAGRSRRPDVTRSDGDGRFALRHVPLGPIALCAVKTDQGSSTAALRLREDTEQRIVLPRQRPTRLVIEARNRTGSGTPATVHVRPLREPGTACGWLPESLSTLELDDRGQGTIRGLPPGRYLVHCSARGRPVLPSAPEDLPAAPIAMAAMSLESAVRIAFDAGGVATLSFCLPSRKLVQVTGTLRDEHGAPLPGKRIGLGPSSQADASQAQTGPDGRFVATVEVHGRELVYARALDPGVTLLGTWGLHTATPHRGADLTLDLTVCPPRPLTGRVVAANDRPLRGVTVRLCDESMFDSGARLVTTTAADGSFAFGLPRCSANVSVRVDSPLGIAAENRVDLSGDAPLAPVTLRLAVPCELSGTVRDASGAPLPGACVQLWEQGVALTRDEKLRETFTDRLGRYRFVGLPAITGGLVVTGEDLVAESALQLDWGERQRVDLTPR